MKHRVRAPKRSASWRPRSSSRPCNKTRAPCVDTLLSDGGADAGRAARDDQCFVGKLHVLPRWSERRSITTSPSTMCCTQDAAPMTAESSASLAGTTENVLTKEGIVRLLADLRAGLTKSSGIASTSPPPRTTVSGKSKLTRLPMAMPICRAAFFDNVFDDFVPRLDQIRPTLDYGCCSDRFQSSPSGRARRHGKRLGHRQRQSPNDWQPPPDIRDGRNHTTGHPSLLGCDQPPSPNPTYRVEFRPRKHIRRQFPYPERHPNRQREPRPAPKRYSP